MRNNQIMKKLLFVGGIFLSLVFLTLLFLFVSSIKKQATPIPQNTHLTPKDTTTTLVKSIVPDAVLPLTPAKTQTFTIVLDPSIDPSKITAVLTASPPSNALQTMPVPLSLSSTKNVLTITTEKDIEPVTTYTITLSLRGTTVLKQSYLSESAKPTPLASTDKTLASFLPHETHSYLLEFDSSQNVYVVHLKYDSGSPSSMSSQVDAVKSEVSAFIKSKGVDPSRITVLYSYK